MITSRDDICIAIISQDQNEAALLLAELELSGYWGCVCLFASVADFNNSAKEQKPDVLIWHTLDASDENLTMLVDFKRHHVCPIIAVGGSETVTGVDTHLNLEAQFVQFLDRVRRIVPLPEFAIVDDPEITESEGKYRDLFERSTDAIMLIDQETHVIIDVNERAVEMYGYDKKEMIGMSLLCIVPRDQHLSIWENTKLMASGSVQLSVEDRTHICKDGTRLPVGISAGLVDVGGRKVFQDIVRDETERKRTEETLKAANENLEEEVRNRTQSLDDRLKRQRAIRILTLAVQEMTKPDDLQKVIGVLCRELKIMDMNFEIASVHYLKDSAKGIFQIYQHLPTEEIIVHAPRLEPHIFNIWQTRVPDYRSDIQHDSGERSSIKWALQRAQVNVVCTFSFPFEQGVLVLLSSKPDAFTVQEQRFLRYVAGVLAVGLARVEDLERVSLQAQQQTVLRVLTEAVHAMVKPEGLQHVLGVLYKELKGIGMDFDVASVHYLKDPEIGLFQTFHCLPGNEIYMLEGRVRPHAFELWKTKKTAYHKNLQEEKGAVYPWVRQKAGIEVACAYSLPFTTGIITLLSEKPDAFTEQEQQFVTSVGEVFAIGFKRMRDLEDLGEQTKQQDALLKINIAVQNMKQKEDLASVLQICLDVLRDMKIDAQGLMVIRIVDEDKGGVEIVSIGVNGLSQSEINLENVRVVNKWRNRSVVHFTNMSTDHKKWALQLANRLGDKIESLIEIPFSMGILRVTSTSKDGFSLQEQQIMRLVAEILGMGITRLNDIDAVVSAERSYRQMADHIEDVIYGVDAESLEFKYLSPAFQRQTGYGLEDIREMGGRVAFLDQVIVGDMLVDPKHNLSVLRQKGAGHKGRSEVWWQCKDGTQKCFEDYWSGIWDEKGTLISADGVLRDVTERKTLERQLFQAQKMETIGALTGGIAHDFNNLMAIIMGNCKYLLRNLGENNSLWEDAEEIRVAGDRAVKLIQQLMAFSRKQILNLTSLDLTEVVTNMLDMMRRLIGADIEIKTLFAPDVVPVLADQVQMEQVILNLVINARDAMPNGGKLTIEIEHAELDDAYAANHLDVSAGAYILLAISDTGIGMDAETQNQVFEPFFTTKEHGRGTGLGLATVFGVVKQCHGHVTIYSELGQGTTFKVYLPVSDEIQRKKTAQSASIAVDGTETILLVEDEDGLRNMIRRDLMALGYTVLAARDGRDALLMFENRAQMPDLIVTDFVMPDMGGLELINRVHELGVDVPFIFISGYMNGAMVHRDLIDPGTPFLQKPFDSEDLALKIRELLDT